MAKMNRRQVLIGGGALAANMLLNSRGGFKQDLLSSVTEQAQRIERNYPWLKPGQSVRLTDELDPYLQIFAEITEKFRFKTSDPLLGSTVLLMNAQLGGFGSGLIVEQDEKLYLSTVGHVVDPEIFANEGHIAIYSPFLGYYIARPDEWNFTQSYTNEHADLSHAFFELTTNDADRFGAHVNYYHEQYLQGKTGIQGLTPVWRMPAENEFMGYLRPDRVGTSESPLQPAVFSGWGSDYTTGGFEPAGENGVSITDYYNRPTFCGGMSGSPIFEVDQQTGIATGGVFGGISTAGFNTDGRYEKDYFETLGDDRGCEEYSVARPFVNGTLDKSIVVSSLDIGRYNNLWELVNSQ